jgi:hypothetical protein
MSIFLYAQNNVVLHTSGSKKESRAEILIPNETFPAFASKRRRSCDDYSLYRQPLLFPDLAFLGDVKKTRKKRAYSKPAEPTKEQEQLGMEGFLKPN